MAFADDFEQHMAPKLRRSCRLHGLFIVVGSETWAQGYAEVMHLAVERGAMRLPPEVLERLQDRISSGLLAACAVVEPLWEAQLALADRVAADIDG